jgi:hypothetical protein
MILEFWNCALHNAVLPSDSVDISVASKADDAKVDLSLWNVGGDDGVGMEEVCGSKWNFLHQLWIRWMMKEATNWLGSHKFDLEVEYQQCKDALKDCIEC